MKSRQSLRDLLHVKEHLEEASKTIINEDWAEGKANIDLALGIIIASIKREKKVKRKDD